MTLALSYRNLGHELNVSHKGLCSDELCYYDLIGLMKLTCSCNKLTSLPELPSTLVELWCYDNQLTSLPTLPTTLIKLFCNNNQLTSLPNLPPNLKILECSNNQLRFLPDLPSSLEELWCSNNKLTTLPDLPYNLECINFEFNRINFSSHYTARSLKLLQHNEKRIKLSLVKVSEIPSLQEWDNINERYTVSRYEPGGDIFEQAQQEIATLLR